MTTNIKDVTLRVPTVPDLTVGRLYTHATDKFKLLLGPMDLGILNTRTAAFAYFTVLDGVLYTAPSGGDLLRAIVEEDELIARQLQYGTTISSFLNAVWHNHIDLLNESEPTLVIEVESIMAEHVITWRAAKDYFDDNYNQDLVWRYLNDYEFYPGDRLDLIEDWQLSEVQDRVDAWESDRYIAITRLTKHYFATAMLMLSMEAEPNDVAHAMAAFMDNYDKLREET